MFQHLIKKSLLLLISLWLVVTATFFLMHAIPGNPFIGDRVIPEEILKALSAHYGLNEPLSIQYFKYLKGLLEGNLGLSIVYHGQSVNQLIAGGFPISARLGFQALFLSIPLGILLGALAAIKKGRWQDHLGALISTIGVSIPNFVLAALLQYLFCVKFPLLPVARFGSFAHTILPTIALAALPTAFITRLVRSSLIEELSQDYIKTALAKGLPLLRVSLKHGLRNALLPLFAYLGPLSVSILTGSFMVEKIFAIPGLGMWMIHSIHIRDYPVILGLTVFYSFFIMVFVFFIDLVYPLIDPRVRLKEESYV